MHGTEQKPYKGKAMEGWLTRQAFRHMLIKRAYTLEQFKQLVEQSTFGTCQIKMGPIGFEARLAKPARADSSTHAA